jgi:tetratricopeptide (TPR) repeat protein
MKLTRRLRRGVRPRAVIPLKYVFARVLLLSLFAIPLFAQRPRMGFQHPVSLVPLGPDDRAVLDKGIATPGTGDNKACSLEPFPGMAATVSVAALEIPAKAQKEYEKACSDLKENKPSGAEKHLVNATQIFPGYVAGWVMLGQVYDSLHQPGQAHDACSRAAASDPKYLPAYLCLAEIAGSQQNWSDVLDFSTRALALDPANDPYAYFFRAIAYFNLNDLREAETGALKAAEIDKSHNQPLIQYLLAEIYQAKNDAAAADSYAEQYRKLTASPDSGANAKAAESPSRAAR